MKGKAKIDIADFKGKITSDDFMLGLFDPYAPLADTVGNRLRHALRESYYNPQTLAENIETSEVVVVSLLLELEPLTVAGAARIASALEVDVEWLRFGGNSGKSPKRNRIDPIGKSNKCSWSPRQWAAMICLFDAMETFHLHERWSELMCLDEEEQLSYAACIEDVFLHSVRFQMQHNELSTAMLQSVSGRPRHD